MQSYLSAFAVVDSVAGSGVAISGLPHATRVDYQAVLPQCNHAISSKQANRTVAGLTVAEYHRSVRMTHQSVRCLEMWEVLFGTIG